MLLAAVLWIHIAFTADPDPAFYINAYHDPDLDQTLPSLKVDFSHEKYTL